MANLDSFFEKHGTAVLTFEVKIGGNIERMSFTREFVLGDKRCDPFAINKRCDEASSKAAFYGTFSNLAKKESKRAAKDYKAWRAGVYREIRAELIAQATMLPASMRKAPTTDEIEMEISRHPKHREKYEEWQEKLLLAEEKEDNMKLLAKCAEIDAEIARSMSSSNKLLIDKGLIEAPSWGRDEYQKAPTPLASNIPIKPKSSDEDY